MATSISVSRSLSKFTGLTSILVRRPTSIFIRRSSRYSLGGHSIFLHRSFRLHSPSLRFRPPVNPTSAFCPSLRLSFAVQYDLRLPASCAVRFTVNSTFVLPSTLLSLCVVTTKGAFAVMSRSPHRNSGKEGILRHNSNSSPPPTPRPPHPIPSSNKIFSLKKNHPSQQSGLSFAAVVHKCRS